MIYTMGNVITFNYVGKRAHEPRPIVYVLHPKWRNLLHGICLTYVSEYDSEILRFLSRKDYAGENADVKKQFFRWKNLMPKNVNPLLLYNTIINRIPALRRAYRKYIPKNMSGIRMISIKI